MTNMLLIDLSSIAHPLFHVSASDPDPNATSIKTVKRVRALASGQPHVAIAIDSGKSFRKDLDPSYKATRPTSDAALQHQIALAIETLKSDGFPIWGAKGYEADDVIASATMMALFSHRAELIGIEGVSIGATVTIASADKDLCQLIGPRVSVHSLTNGTVYDAEAVQAKYGVAPNQMVDYLALVGDPSDNIKGAKGIGPKTAAELLKKYGNLEDLYVALKEHGTQFTPAMASNLYEFKPRVELTRELIRLKTDAPIPFDEIFKERVPMDTEVFDDIDEAMPTIEHAIAGAKAELESSILRLSDQPTTRASEISRPDTIGAKNDQAQGIMTPVAPIPAEATQGFHMRALPSKQTDVTSTPPRLTPPAEPPKRPTEAFAAPVVTMVRSETTWDQELEPRDLRECEALAQRLFASRLFSAYGTYQGVMSTIIAGRELGLAAMTSLRLFQIIEGKPSMSADMIRGLVQRSPLCEFFRCTKRTAEKATWITKRKGDDVPTQLSFTIEQGRAAWTKDQRAWDASAWGKRPINMVTKSASSELARLVYADIVGNMYSKEELIGED